MSTTQRIVDWGFACGRYYLEVAGYVVAMEGDPVREIELSPHYPADLARAFGEKQFWTGDLIKRVVEKYHQKVAETPREEGP
jgi:hypothetical protein